MTLDYQLVKLALRTVLLTVPGIPASKNCVFDDAPPDGVIYTPVATTPYLIERFAPASSALGGGKHGTIESRGLYIVQVFGPSGVGNMGIMATCKGILDAFPPAASFAIGGSPGGLFVRVRGDQAPYPSGLTRLETGASFAQVTVPWYVLFNNS